MISKKKMLSLGIGVAISALILSYFIENRTIHIFPSNNRHIEVFADSDDRPEGKSTINSFVVTDDSISLSYTLRKGLIFPYAGFVLDTKEDRWDIPENGTLILEVAPLPGPQEMVLQLITDLEGFSVDSLPGTWIPFQYEVVIPAGESQIKIPISHFKPPGWWYNNHRLNVDSHPLPNFRKIRRFLVQNSSYNFANQLQHVTLLNCRITKQTPTMRLILGSILFIILIAVQLPQKKILSYTQRNLQNDKDLEFELVIEYIGSNYHRSEITLDDISIATELSTKKIRLLLRDGADTTFRQYLTQVRMTEASRLLKESDRSIADISLHVGYKHATTFTKIFRTLFNCTPQQFRANG